MKHKTILFLTTISLLVISLQFNMVAAEAPERDMSAKDYVAIYATQNDVDPNLAISVMMCESRGKQESIGDGKRALGIFQYWNETWNRHSEKYFGSVLDKHSIMDQAKVATAALSGGEAREWTSYRAIMNGGSYTFRYKLTGEMITVKCEKKNYL